MSTSFILDVIAHRPWLIDQAGLELITGIADRTALESPTALAERLGRPLDNSHCTEMVGHTAIIPISGPMFPKANLFTEVSGATSTESVAQDFVQALDDPSVHAIVLDINSPGGAVDGVSELAALIAQSRGMKPVTAYVGNMACSAAYWVASAADSIVVSDTAVLGSIGVVTQYVKRNEPGVSRMDIVSTQSPKKCLDPGTDAGKAEVQATIDALAQVFVETVAQNRGVSVNTVLEKFGQGGVRVGSKAVALGMADRLGSRSDAINAAGTSFQSRSFAAAVTEEEMTISNNPSQATVVAPAAAPEPLTVALVVSRNPEVAEVLRAEGRSEAKAGLEVALAAARTESAGLERARITDINALALPGYEVLAAEAVASGKSASDFAVAQARAQKAQGSKLIAAIQADEAVVAVVGTPPAPASEAKPVKVDLSLPVEDRAKAAWEKDPQIRAEFGELSIYTSYMRANESGRVRILSRSKE